MKRCFFILFLLEISLSLFAGLPEQTVIKFEGSEFEKKAFVNKAVFFTNKNYIIDGIPSGFKNFEFLAHNSNSKIKGTIISDRDGFVYIIAPPGLHLEGWQQIVNSEFSYDDYKNSILVIYQKKVKAGQRVPLPEINRFAGVTPIAYSIQYQQKGIVRVEGELIDIRKASIGNQVFPQNSTFRFNKTLPKILENKEYTVSLIENKGVVKIMNDSESDVFIAYSSDILKSKDWKYTGDSFTISSARKYYVYKLNDKQTDNWIDVPEFSGGKGLVSPTLVFSEKMLWSNPLKVPGVVITRSQDIKNLFITNPSIVKLPDGRYLASCSGALRTKSVKGGVSFFISEDRGETWTVQSANSIVMTFCNLFIHKGELYLMGTNRGYKDVVISKSIDWGNTWSNPVDSLNGLLVKGGFYHSAPVPVVVHNGRIWRSMENSDNNSGANKRALVMSAPANADLLNASNWTLTNELSFEVPDEIKRNRDFKQWLEGNVLVDREGKVVNILRVDELKEGGFAAITHVNNVGKLTYQAEHDLIQFPGGGVKFTIRFDSLSNKYWTISNAAFDEDMIKTHKGKYKNGVHASLLRNRVVLMYSHDLKNWIVKDTLISADNPFFHGFQYTDWQFDRSDIIAVTRTAFEEERGLPVRQHDANFLTFHRFKDFRESKVITIIPKRN